MFVDMKTIAVVPLIIASALAVLEDYSGEAQCRAISEVRGVDERTKTIRYLETENGSAHPSVQLVMPREFPVDSPVTYAALAFREQDVAHNCITRGEAVAKTDLFRPVEINPDLSVLVTWMTPASLLPDSDHNIVDHTVAVYRFDHFTEIQWTHFLQNYNDYRPIGCGKIEYTDCDDDVTAIVSSLQQPEAAELGSGHGEPVKRKWAHVADYRENDGLTSAEQPDESPTSAEQSPDALVSAEQAPDALVSAEQAPDKLRKRPEPAQFQAPPPLLKRIAERLKALLTRFGTSIKNNYKKTMNWIQSKIKRKP